MVQPAERLLSPSADRRPRSPLQRYLERLHESLAAVELGEVASYIPELAGVEPDTFGICLATPSGAVYEAGDTGHRFTLQSISKPLTYGLALSDAGIARVRRTVGVEPSGDAFNAISLDTESGLPVNPMINAGAIATVSLVGDLPVRGSRFDRILDAYSTYAGRQLDVDEAVYRSERETGHRNRAIAHLLRAGDIVRDEVEQTVDAYFRQCAVEVDCRDLALVGATLANGGVNPSTRQASARRRARPPRPLRDDHLRHVRRRRRVAVHGGSAREERRLRRGPGDPPGTSRHRRLLSPARPTRQQRPRVSACAAVAQDFDVHLLDGGRPAVLPIRATYTARRRRVEAHTPGCRARGARSARALLPRPRGAG